MLQSLYYLQPMTINEADTYAGIRATPIDLKDETVMADAIRKQMLSVALLKHQLYDKDDPEYDNMKQVQASLIGLRVDGAERWFVSSEDARGLSEDSKMAVLLVNGDNNRFSAVRLTLERPDEHLTAGHWVQRRDALLHAVRRGWALTQSNRQNDEWDATASETFSTHASTLPSSTWKRSETEPVNQLMLKAWQERLQPLLRWPVKKKASAIICDPRRGGAERRDCATVRSLQRVLKTIPVDLNEGGDLVDVLYNAFDGYGSVQSHLQDLDQIVIGLKTDKGFKCSLHQLRKSNQSEEQRFGVSFGIYLMSVNQANGLVKVSYVEPRSHLKSLTVSDWEDKDDFLRFLLAK